MFLRLSLILTFLVSNSLFAKEMVVISRQSTFKLKYDAGMVSLKGPQVDLNLIRNECNSDIIEVFTMRMNSVLRSASLQKSQAPGNFQFILDGEEYFESMHSRRGGVLLTLPKELQRMKLEEEALCETK